MLSAQAVVHRTDNSADLPRVVLICPVRKCALPLEYGMIQTDFEQHVKLCWAKNYLTSSFNDAVKCPLGHITFQEDYATHNLCHAVASDNLKHAVKLKSLLSLYTIIPYAFTTPLRDLREIPIMTFNQHCTHAETLQAQADFLMLAKMAINRHLQYQTLCTKCKTEVREESFPPLPYMHYVHNNEIHYSRTGDYIPSNYSQLGSTEPQHFLKEPTAALFHIVSGHSRSTEQQPIIPLPTNPVPIQSTTSEQQPPESSQCSVIQTSDGPENQNTY